MQDLSLEQESGEGSFSNQVRQSFLNLVPIILTRVP